MKMPFALTLTLSLTLSLPVETDDGELLLRINDLLLCQFRVPPKINTLELYVSECAFAEL